MRKIWIILLALSMVSALCACKKTAENNDIPNTPKTENTPTAEDKAPSNPPSVNDYLTEDAVAVIPENDAISSIPDINIPEKVERGNQIGDYCAAAKLEILDEDGGTGVFIDPSATGRPTIIYFWGTWNALGVEGLTYLDRIAAELGEDISIIAVHTLALGEDLTKFIGVEYPDSTVFFTLDSGAEFAGDYYTALGGSDTYPYTVVLNSKGQIVEIIHTHITYDLMREALDLACQ